MPTPTRNRGTRNRLRLTTMAEVKEWVKGQIELYSEDEMDRVSKADEAQEQGQYVDAGTFLAVAAKKKIVRQKLRKLLSAMS